METEKDPQQREVPTPDEATPLAPGVWVTEATGFASVPPRAQSDLQEACEQKIAEGEKAADAAPENELMTARGEPAERSEEAQQQAPRIETYPER